MILIMKISNFVVIIQNIKKQRKFYKFLNSQIKKNKYSLKKDYCKGLKIMKEFYIKKILIHKLKKKKKKNKSLQKI